MKIRLLSDLHLEFFGSRWLHFVDDLASVEATSPCDVLVLAGDIAAHDGIEQALNAFCQRFAQVVYVSGNHERYASTPTKVDRAIEEVWARRDNLHYLDASPAIFEEATFRGGTLWFEDPKSDDSKWALNDFCMISNFEPWVYEENAKMRRYLETFVEEGDIVVTHHLPSLKSVHPKYADSELNKFFVSPMDRLIERSKPTLWLHGHTHESCDYLIGKTRVVCNPYGYDLVDTNPNFLPNLTIEI
jgi:Icc-related predicted phosphoesterase